MPDMPTSPAVEAYRAALGPGRTDAFAVTPLDRSGVPVWAVSHAGDRFLGAYGYGPSDAVALTGAFGELLESHRSSLALPLLPRRRASWRELGRAGLEAVHPWALCPPAGSPVDGGTDLVWVAARRVADDGEVWLPIEAVASSPADLPAGYEPLTTPVTNGLGAHLDLPRALAHGAEELVQRDGNGLSFRALDAGVVVRFGPGEPGGEAGAALDALAAAGLEVVVKLASDDLGLTNLYVVAARPDPDGPPGSALAASGCGEAADADPCRALAKAALEYAASRVRKVASHGPLGDVARLAEPGYLDAVRRLVDPAREERRALEAMAGWVDLDAAALWDRLAPTRAERREVAWSEVAAGRGGLGPGAAGAGREEARPGATGTAGRLAAEGFDVLVVDLSPADGSIAVAKVVAPGLEVETLSYRRIGERNARRLLTPGAVVGADGADLPLAGQGSPPPGAVAVRLLPDAVERLGGPVWYDPAVADAAVGGLYPLYREPTRHAVPLAAGGGR